MDSRERVLRSIKHEEVDRTPSYYLGTGSITSALTERFGISSPNAEHQLLNHLGTDLAYFSPSLIPKPGEDRHGFCMGSVHAKMVEGKSDVVVEKAPVEEAVTIEDLDKWSWPDPDWYNYEISRKAFGLLNGKAIVAYDMGIVMLCAMGARGMEQLMMDMAGEPEMAHAIFKRIADFNYERSRRILEANKGVVDILGIGDDVAGQSGLFFSLDMWREYLKPHLARMVELCHEYKVIPYFHGCGGFSVLFPDFIDMGIECVGRLQTEAKGNDFREVKREFGRDLCLWGAVDGQHVVIEGSQEEVREHVKRLLDIGAEGSGFIAGPTHSFTEDTPVENVIAVYKVLGGMRMD